MPATKVRRRTSAETHEEKVARLEEENRRLREEMRRAYRLASLGTMTAMVAHEWRNILTPIINYAELARGNPALMAKAIDRAADGGQRAIDICEAFLDLARGEPAPPEEVGLARLVRDTLTAMGRDPRRDGIRMTVEIPDDLTVVTRKLELQHVLLNLLLNARWAVAARRGSGKVHVAAERTEDGVVIRVADNGEGIDPENLQRIFEPFFTTRDGSDGQPAGNGLGLAICREILAALGGQITVTSQKGRGATFTVRLD